MNSAPKPNPTIATFSFLWLMNLRQIATRLKQYTFHVHVNLNSNAPNTPVSTQTVNGKLRKPLAAKESARDGSPKLFSKFDAPGFANNGDANLAGILQIFFNFAGNISRQTVGHFVAHFIWPDHHAQLPA